MPTILDGERFGAKRPAQRAWLERVISSRGRHLHELYSDGYTLYGHAALAAMTADIRAESDPRIEETDSRYRGRLPIEYGAAPAWPDAERPLVLDEIAERFGITRQGVHQTEQRAFAKLRKNKLICELADQPLAQSRWTRAHEAALQRAPRMSFVKAELERLRGVMRARGANQLTKAEQAAARQNIDLLFREWVGAPRETRRPGPRRCAALHRATRRHAS